MNQKRDDEVVYDDYETRRSRRNASQKIRKWVGDVDPNLIDEYEDTDGLDGVPKFERLRSRRRPRYDD